MADFVPFYKSVTGHIRTLLMLTSQTLSVFQASGSPGDVYWATGTAPRTVEMQFCTQKNYLDPVWLGNLPLTRYSTDDNNYWHDLCGFLILPNDDSVAHTAFCIQLQATSGGYDPTTYSGTPYFYTRVCVKDLLTNNVLSRTSSGSGTVLHPDNVGIENCYFLIQPSEINGRPAIKFNIRCNASNETTKFSWYRGTGGSFFTDDQSGSWGGLSVGGNPSIKEITDPNEQDEGDPDDEDKGGGTSGTGGGDGTYTIIKDNVPIPNMPTLTAGAAGFVTLYNPSAAILRLLADELNSDNVIQWIINYFEKPQDMVAGLGIVPVQPTTIGSFKPKLGSKSINIAMPVIEDQFVEKDCGTLDIYKFYGSAFDYSPYSQIQIFLPYIGLKELNIDEVMGKTIGVKYHIDLFTGNCVAFVTVYNSGVEAVRYQFSGNCLQQIPINATSYDDAITNGIRLATMAVASIATAGAAGAAAGAAATEAGATAAEASTAAAIAESATAAEAGRELAGSTLSAIMTSKPHVERSGSLGGSIGLMSVQTPFIVRVIPRQSLPEGYKDYAGYPSNITAVLSSLSGFTKMEKVKLTGINATDDELSEIYRLLYSGVIL